MNCNNSFVFVFHNTQFNIFPVPILNRDRDSFLKALFFARNVCFVLYLQVFLACKCLVCVCDVFGVVVVGFRKLLAKNGWFELYLQMCHLLHFKRVTLFWFLTKRKHVNGLFLKRNPIFACIFFFHFFPYLMKAIVIAWFSRVQGWIPKFRVLVYSQYFRLEYQVFDLLINSYEFVFFFG